jgi:hypothetical protein
VPGCESYVIFLEINRIAENNAKLAGNDRELKIPAKPDAGGLRSDVIEFDAFSVLLAELG